jgi:hypothetical protein
MGLGHPPPRLHRRISPQCPLSTVPHPTGPSHGRSGRQGQGSRWRVGRGHCDGVVEEFRQELDRCGGDSCDMMYKYQVQRLGVCNAMHADRLFGRKVRLAGIQSTQPPRPALNTSSCSLARTAAPQPLRDSATPRLAALERVHNDRVPWLVVLVHRHLLDRVDHLETSHGLSKDTRGYSQHDIQGSSTQNPSSL